MKFQPLSSALACGSNHTGQIERYPCALTCLCRDCFVSSQRRGGEFAVTHCPHHRGSVTDVTGEANIKSMSC